MRAMTLTDRIMNDPLHTGRLVAELIGAHSPHAVLLGLTAPEIGYAVKLKDRLDTRVTADGVMGLFLAEDGQQYRITVEPVYEDEGRAA